MAEQRFNRNYLILGGLALATLAAFWFIENPPIGNRERSEETVEIVDDLNQEILELESSILELELVYSEKDAELDQSKELIQQKNARLSILEQRIDSLEERGALDAETIRRLRENLARARQVTQSRDKVNVLVQDISYLTRNTDSLSLTLRKRDSMLREAQALIEIYQQELKECGNRGASIPKPRVEDLNDEPRLWADNFKVYNQLQDGSREEIRGQIDGKKIEQLQFCFDLKGNQLVDNGLKDIYLVMSTTGGRLVSSREGGSGTFILNGREQMYTTAAKVEHKKGSSNAVCMDYQQNEGYAFGRHEIKLYYDGVIIDRGYINIYD